MATDKITGASETVCGITVRPLSVRNIGQLIAAAKQYLRAEKARELAVQEWLSPQEKSAEMREYTAQLDRDSDITTEAGQAMLIGYFSTLEGINHAIDLCAGKAVELQFDDQEKMGSILESIMRISGFNGDDSDAKKEPPGCEAGSP